MIRVIPGVVSSTRPSDDTRNKGQTDPTFLAPRKREVVAFVRCPRRMIGFDTNGIEKADDGFDSGALENELSVRIIKWYLILCCFLLAFFSVNSPYT